MVSCVAETATGSEVFFLTGSNLIMGLITYSIVGDTGVPLLLEIAADKLDLADMLPSYPIYK